MQKSLNKNKEYVCPNCNRKLPNADLFTKTKCIWCDLAYWNKVKNKGRKA